MAKNSLFAVLARSPWWVSLLVAGVLVMLAFALLPQDYRVVGALSATPFVVISAIAARRQWHLPSAAQVEKTLLAVRAMPWPAFSQVLQAAFEREGHEVTAVQAQSHDFELQRSGRRMLVSARRWKSARAGLEVFKALQAAREAADATDALCICLGDLTDTARPFAAQHKVAVWRAPELAQRLRGLLPAASQGKPRP